MRTLRFAVLAAALTVLVVGAASSPVVGQRAPRARDLGVPFDGTPGPLNAITDVAGVEVGHATIIAGEGALVVGQGPVRTGVTAVLPRGRDSMASRSFAGWFSLNGNGEMTGTTWIEESGFLEGPVHDHQHAQRRRGARRGHPVAHQAAATPDASGYWWSLPVVAETYDGVLNDINGFHVKPRARLRRARRRPRAAPCAEGNVGGGTGMVCYGFKGGIGTASRSWRRERRRLHRRRARAGNFGRRPQLLVAGVPVGTRASADPGAGGAGRRPGARRSGSIIIVVATDAPLLPHQLKRLARRATLGLARTGGLSGNGSGDIFLAFSTANPDAFKASGLASLAMVSNEEISPIFEATAWATEEAIINALVAAETMTGADGRRVERLPHDRLREALRKYNRLAP